MLGKKKKMKFFTIVAIQKSSSRIPFLVLYLNQGCYDSEGLKKKNIQDFGGVTSWKNRMKNGKL
jgi:hypothetical protein